MKRRLINKHLIILTSLLAYCAFLHFSGIYCPFRALTGYPCPTCGMTRSLTALLLFDLHSYFFYNPMALPVLIAVFLGFHYKIKWINQRLAQKYIIVTSILTASLYIFRLIVGFAI